MAISKITTPTQLSLAQELASINSQNKVTQIQPGNDQTIDDFWKNFVDPALPDPNTVIKWFRLLSDYVDQDDAVFALRCYGNWVSYITRDDYTLRRGFYNLTDKDYSFFYTDNFFAAYFAKMAVDNFVPTLSEFKSMMLSREFPARFGLSAATERARASYSIDGKKGRDPGFQTNGYKIAHVVDSGKRIFYNGQETTIGQICDKYCNRGDYYDWTLHSDSFGDYYARDLKMNSVARELLVAHFLRFACPMNYIFTPKKDCHVLGVKVPMNDIAECVELQQYAMHKFYALYGNDYDVFLNRIMLPPSLTLQAIPKAAVLGKKTIDISYGYNIKTNSGSTTKMKKVKTSSNINKTKNVTPMPRINSTNILATLRGMQAAGTLPATVTLTNKTNFKYFLETKTDVNAINTYLNSIESNAFKVLLKNKGLSHPQDIYACSDLNILVDVLDELVNHRSSPDVIAALKIGTQACRPALCYLIVHLLLNSIANLFSKMGITI